MLSADYSQIELRVIAALSEDPNMISAFNKNLDIHSSTAAKVFNVKLEDVTKEQRSNAKTVNFGIIYGVSAFGLSNQTSLQDLSLNYLLNLTTMLIQNLRTISQVKLILQEKMVMSKLY